MVGQKVQVAGDLLGPRLPEPTCISLPAPERPSGRQGRPRHRRPLVPKGPQPGGLCAAFLLPGKGHPEGGGHREPRTPHPGGQGHGRVARRRRPGMQPQPKASAAPLGLGRAGGGPLAYRVRRLRRLAAIRAAALDGAVARTGATVCPACKKCVSRRFPEAGWLRSDRTQAALHVIGKRTALSLPLACACPVPAAPRPVPCRRPSPPAIAAPHTFSVPRRS